MYKRTYMEHYMKNLLLLSIFAMGALQASPSIRPDVKLQERNGTILRQVEPNWLGQVVKSYPTGMPEIILFYKPLADGSEIPVKQVFYYENSAIQIEMDVAVVSNDSPG